MSINVIELCSGPGRNINTILKKLRPKTFTAVDYDKQCILEIDERWRRYEACEVKAIA